MKRCIWLVVLLTVMPVSSVVFGQEQEPPHPRPPDEVFRDIQVREKQLDIEQRESELEYERAVRNLKLEEQKLGLNKKRQALERQEHRGPACPHCGARGGILLAVCVIINLLLAIWVYQDIRKRNAGSGIWIVVTLLAGVFGVIAYAIVRIGDKE